MIQRAEIESRGTFKVQRGVTKIVKLRGQRKVTRVTERVASGNCEECLRGQRVIDLGQKV